MESKLVLGLTLCFLLQGGFPSFTKGESENDTISQGLGPPSNFLSVLKDIGEKVGGVAQNAGDKIAKSGVLVDIGKNVGGVAQEAKKNLGTLAAGGAQLAGHELEKALQDGAKDNREYATCFKEVEGCKDKPSGEELCTNIKLVMYCAFKNCPKLKRTDGRDMLNKILEPYGIVPNCPVQAEQMVEAYNSEMSKPSSSSNRLSSLPPIFVVASTFLRTWALK